MEWDHNLASDAKVKGNFVILWSSGKYWASIQSIVLSRYASGSSSSLPENSGLKYDKFMAMGAGSTGWGGTGGNGGSSCGRTDDMVLAIVLLDLLVKLVVDLPTVDQLAVQLFHLVQLVVTVFLPHSSKSCLMK